MKNVTVTLDEEVARWARVWAARENTSVSRFLGRLLEERMLSEAGYRAAQESFLGRGASVLKKGGRYPTRDEVHER